MALADMRTGWPPGLLQDDDRKLSRWLASRPDARYQFRKNMKPKFIQLLETCVLDGVIVGHTRAYKHNDSPTVAEINEAIVNAVWLEIYEWFDFDEEQERT